MSADVLQILVLTKFPVDATLEANLGNCDLLSVARFLYYGEADKDCIHTRLPDLAIIDDIRHGSDCVSLAKTLVHYKVPFLLCSATSDNANELDPALQKAAWFGKPSRPDELTAIIKAAAALGRRARYSQ